MQSSIIDVTEKVLRTERVRSGGAAAVHRGYVHFLVALLFFMPVALFAHNSSQDSSEFAPFVEPGFPFITTTVDARGMGPDHPKNNLTVRGLAMQLENGAYATFDPDLLRMAVGWTGEFVSLTTMAQVSYHRQKYKQNEIPEVLGEDIFGTGIYPGWMGETPRFEDPRRRGPNPEAHRVAGFDEGMPSYEGILDETEVESLILFIESLSG